MKKKSNSGFTFVELLAVIMILVFISLITTPIIKKIITNVRKNAFGESVNRLLVSGTHYIEEYLIEFHDSVPYPVTFNCDGKRCSNSSGRILEFSGDVPISGTVTIAGADNIYATHITNNKWCASGYKGKLDIADTCSKLDHSAPVINKQNKVRIASTANKVIVIFPIDLMKDDETDIIKYVVNIKKEEKVIKSIVRASFKELTYVVFDKLADETLYNIEIVGYNGNNLNTTITKSIKTNKLNNPSIKYNNKPMLIQNNYFKSQEVKINFNNNETYIKSTKDGILNKTILGICDNNKNNCTPLNTKEIKANIWYKVDKDIKILYESDMSGVLYLNDTAVNLAGLDNDEPIINLKDNIIKSDFAILNYNAYDVKSRIGSYTCKYGTTMKMNKESLYINSMNCLINDLKPNTNYYYEICVKDKLGNKKCENSTFKTLESVSNISISYENSTSSITNDYLNKQIIKIENKSNDSYYIYSDLEAIISDNQIEECGTFTLPGNCNKINTNKINVNTWYKISNNIKVLYSKDSNVLGNLIIYNGNSYNVKIAKIENTLPTAPKITGGNVEWTNQPQTISIEEEGIAFSGVAGYEYLILTSNIKPTASFAANGTGNSINITESGTKYIYFRTVSNGNIKSPWSEVKIINVDFEIPDKTEFRFVEGFSSNIPQKNVEIILSCKDNIGIKNYQVDVDGNGISDMETQSTFIPEKGFTSSHLRFRAVDYAGNIGDWSDEIILKIEN